jgi:hypothetical protein
VQVWLGAIDEAEMQELVVDAWRMVVSKERRVGLRRRAFRVRQRI